ncbi:conserved hypothetical integral membrane protein [Catalinimonas alkaloidigena]|uniref:Conserved hypothetical integral membrane protein n=1 Tax=Catalinimonas alkaloidigena TaxID=1075417 RepID=A0A1G9GRW6_9BACT|nr:putative sulfate exporter family transporter [Catalinimonas alkaloidigena]SDL03429.1 conserved hypothetical integral membrane protein [Catalinimonas alkaloidigena]
METSENYPLPHRLTTWHRRLQGLLERSVTYREIIFVLALAVCLLPEITPPLALVLGLIVAQLIGHPFLHLNHKATRWLLQGSVVGLGFGMHAGSALAAGKMGITFTVISILGTLVVGIALGKLLRLDRITAYLIAGGTAICGGSAIAALSPVLNAKEQQISVALGTIFLLNSVALFLFPWVGHLLDLSQTQFGLWAALAIHDTSSVVGAAGHYGPQALELATTVKLARALWIIPVALVTSLLFKTRGANVTIPYFIGGFVVAMVLNTYVPMLRPVGAVVVPLAHTGLTLTLFLIGAGLSRQALRAVGFRPLVQGVLLWGLISVAALALVLQWHG